jgi:3-oxoadipate enol-lactonase
VPFADHGGTRIHYRDLGRADGEPLVLVMGLGGSGKAWWRLLPALEDRFRLLVPDNRGTGESDPVRGALTLRAMVGDVLAVLDHAGVERAHVHGMVAQHLALDHPDRVRSLILGCTTALARSGQPPWRLLGASALRPLLGPGRSWPVLSRVLYAQRTFDEAPQRIAEDLDLRLRDPTPPQTVYAQLLAIAGHDVRSRLRELGRFPVTVLHGDEDRLVVPARGRALAAAIPGAVFVMIEGCGHLMTTDAQESTAHAVLAHLDRCAAPAAGAG